MAGLRLDGASIIVAGATGGIGAPLARALAGRGARLTLVARTEVRLEALVASGVEGVAVPADIVDADACARVVESARRTHGQVDGVVNATGAVAFGPLVELADGVLEALFAANVYGPLRLVRAALPHLQPGGVVVNFSAVVAEQPTADMAAYSATKGALTALSGALQKELRRAHVHVIDVRPPHTETGLAERPLDGIAPRLPPGLDPEVVAARVVRAIEDGERALPASAFTAG